MSKRLYKGDVSWFILQHKKPIAYSTIATRDLINALSEEGGTICEVHSSINYNKEAKAVLQVYIDQSYGNQIAFEWFKG